MGVAELRIIKKYPNRRLYDTEISRYITLEDIRNLVRDEIEFQVIDTSSQEDITRNILLQIILEQESSGKPLLTTNVLAQMIRFYGDTVHSLFAPYLEQSLSLFSEQQRRIQEQVREVWPGNPMEAMADLAQRNLELWQQLQRDFFRASGVLIEHEDHSEAESGNTEFDNKP